MTAPAPTTPAFAMYRALVGIGLVCAALTVAAYQGTEPIIRAKKIAARERAVLAVLPGAVTSAAFTPAADGHYEATPPDRQGVPLVFAGYGPDGQLVGLALEAQATGYQDVIRLVYGYAPDRQAIIGIRVLDSRETPGLGDRIESDPDFLANFRALDVALTADGSAIAHPIEGRKHGTKTSPWQIDCITGATISSQTVARMLRESTTATLPTVARRLDDFRKAAPR